MKKSNILSLVASSTKGRITLEDDIAWMIKQNGLRSSFEKVLFLMKCLFSRVRTGELSKVQSPGLFRFYTS